MDKFDVLRSLPADKRDLLLKAVQRKKVDNRVSVLPRREQSEPIPASFSQERMWFLNELVPGNPAYNIFLSVRVKGGLNIDILNHTINGIIKRHETLRTRFVTVDGRLVVKLDAELKTQCRVVDLTQLSSYEKEKSIYQLTDEEVKKSFDLASTPLFRITLLKLEEKCYIMLINMHHIISDGWSTGLFLKEITVLYQAGIKGLEAGLPQLEYTYGDYAFWQREYLKGSVLDKKLSFWKKYLGYSSLMLDLPLDKPKQSLQSNMGASSRFAVPDNISTRIKEICRKENITLFTFLLTAFNVLLYKYTYQEDIIVGTPVANRTRSEFEGLIGCFVNTIPLRTDISGNPTFREVLERVSKSNAEAFDNQDMPFDVLVEELHLERDLSRHPIFQVMFVLQNASYKTIGIENVEFEIMNTDSRTSKFDLTLEVYEEEVINGRFEYSTDIFESSTIVRMTEKYINLLKNIVNDYGQRVMEIDILGEQERTLILKEWNNTRVEYPKVPSIISLFENQVIKTPDSIAIIFDNKNLTYRDFNSKANQLAHFLIKLGVGRETIVGICMERSFEMVIAIYAILKAGGAYLPIDPDYPGDRIKFIIEDAKVPIVLVQKHLENLFDNSDATVICADTQWSEISIERTDNPVCQNKQEDLAYVIYTSGSTGNPKGVMNTHGGLYNRLMWHQKKFMADDSDTILQKTPYSFDVSVWEFFWPLMCGARLLIAAPGGHKDCRYLADIIRANKVTAVHFVPSMLRAFLGEEGIGECSSLKRVICSGEALTGDIQKLFFEVFGNTLLYNLYGPTEAAIDVSCWECRNDGSSNVPIGKPIDNIQLYILDQKLKPVAAGVPGELYIGGAGLARGYLNKPELTRERFILNPFRSMPGEYLYKTGDLAKFKADGNIEYLGRNDFQVKIRGLRVELGEIEALLLQHPCIQEAVVTAREDVPGSKRLVAYIVPDKTNAPEDKEIKGYLMKKLPEYMVPSLIIRLDKLPLLNNGKINRKGLPAPDYSQLRGNRKYVAPRTPVEEKLAGIWSKVLKINQVSICDKFFELGGDSILSIQIVSLANQAGIKITPKQIFEHQSIEELSCVAVLEKTACTEQGMVTGSVPLTPIQKWFFEQELTEPHYFNQAVLLKSKRPISRDTLNSAVQTLIIKHDALRMRFNRTKDGWEQFNSAFDGTIPLEWIEVESSTGIEEFIKNRASALQGSLDITKGPVVRLAYFEIKDAGSGYLLIISHHLVIDGVSWRILINDLELICTGSPDLPPKTTSFKQYSEYLNDYTINEEELLPYLNTFQNEEQGTEFPGASKDKGKNTVESLKCISTALSGEETEELVTETTKTFHTNINDILAAALAETFFSFSGNRTLLIDMESHGRDKVDTEIDVSGTIGWFTSIYPVLLDIRASQSLGDSIKTVKEQLRLSAKNCLAYGILKYNKHDSEAKRLILKNPKADILFNYLGQFDSTFSEESLFETADIPIGNTQSSKQRRSHLLEINSHIIGGKLYVNWNYSRNIYKESLAQDIAQRFMDILRKLMEYCRTEQGGFTPSDFPLTELTQEKIDSLLCKYTDIEDVYPLSAMQQVVLSHNLYSRKSGTDIQLITWNIEGSLDLKMFKEAWQQVISSHPILRTSFIWRKLKQPVQVVHCSANPEFLYIDLSTKSADYQEEEADRIVQEWGRKSFNVEESTLMRFCIIKLGENSFKFIWVYWTSLFDNWSWTRIVSEVLTYYRTYVKGTQITGRNSVPFKEYIKWVLGQDEDEEKRFWIEELKAFNAKMDMNIDRKSSELISSAFEPGQEEIRLSGEETEKINTYAKNHGLTLGSIVQGAWVLTLGFFTDEQDILFSVLSYGRPASLSGVDTIVGLLANDLPLRVKIKKEAYAVEWLGDIQKKNVTVRQYDYVPIEQIIKWSKIPFSTIQKAIYERNLIFSRAPEDEMLSKQSADEDIKFNGFNNSLKFNVPLRVYVEPDDRITIRIKYNKAVFEQDAITRILDKIYEYVMKLTDKQKSKINELL